MTKSIYVATITAICVAIASAIALLQFSADRPSISVKVIDVSLSEPKFDWTDIVQKLNSIEQTYSEETGTHVIALQQLAEVQSIDLHNNHTFNSELTDAIEQYREREDKLELLGAAVDSLRADSQDLISELQRIEEQYSDVTRFGVLSLQSSLESAPADGLVDQDVRGSLEHLSRTYRDRREDLRMVVSELESITTQPDKKHDRRRLKAEVLVVNRSRSDNTIIGRALLRIYNEARRSRVRLVLQGDGDLDGYSVAKLLFQSQLAKDLDRQNNALLRDMADHLDLAELRCQVAIEDLHGEVWKSEEVQCSGGNDWQRLETHLPLAQAK